MEVNQQCMNAADSEDLGITWEKPRHPRYAVTSQRQASFATWPSDAPVSSEGLVDAGFAYTGKDDAVRCFYCNGGLKNWRRGDDPWREHAQFYPKCPYVHLVKGRDFVDEVTGRLESDGAGAQETSSSVDQDPLKSAAAVSCLEMGFSEEDVRRAIKTFSESHGSRSFSGAELCEILLG